YIDNITIKELKTNYNKELLKLGIRYFIDKYIISINKVLYNLELIRVIVLEFKLD
ncbi:hypothetical protein FB567DRAFT_434510, partial [Paraphoma chrysanthemicola]